MTALDRLKQIAESVRARNLSSKRGHPKYTASVTSEEELALTEGVLQLLAVAEAAAKYVEAYQDNDTYCPTREYEANIALAAAIDAMRKAVGG